MAFNEDMNIEVLVLVFFRFEDLLRAITIARSDICEAMVFALDNAESASEVPSPQPADSQA